MQDSWAYKNPNSCINRSIGQIGQRVRPCGATIYQKCHFGAEFPWAAPRILRWGYKTGFASGASEKKFLVPPTFPNVGVQASKYQ